MPDLLYVALTVGFFVLAAGFVSVCDRIIGPDSDHGDPVGAGEADPERLASGGPEVTAADTAGVAS